MAGVLSVRASVPSATKIALWLPDSKGRLRAARLDGTSTLSRRKRIAICRSVYDSASPVWVDLDDPPGSAFLALPLAFRERAYGVLTVVASSRELRRKRPALEATATQAGALLGAWRSASEMREQLALGLACTAHELLRPIVAAKAAIESVLHRQRSEGSPDLLRHSQRELEHLAALTDAMIRLGAGDGALEDQLVDLAHVAREAVASCEWESGDRRLSVSAPGGDHLMVRADPAQLQIAIANLVRNAVSFAPKGSRVDVEVRAADGRIQLSVHDEGPGVPTHDLETIFDPRVQHRDPRTANGHQGLGLFIARRIVEAHRGAIWAEPGKGARFVIELPGRSLSMADAS
ncbi:MAG TPA: HAMP domain-containing sensor histidine kinase [Actinomycetota bacterium]|nr:HAMP domain-containing sensor histidine kinase [Actinomycetota bacterium]